MKKIILFLGCCLLGWGITDLMAQQANVAAGGTATGAGGTVSFSIGQVDYLTATGSNGTITQGVQQPAGGIHFLSGYLTYDNMAGTAMNNCTVQLKQGNTVISSTTTDASGYYEFSNPEPGTYTLNAMTTKAWGGVDATDALLILKHFIGMTTLTGLAVAAADVDASGYVNTTDALLTARRFVGSLASFIPGDWAFEHPTVIVPAGTDVTTNFKALCFGDVDGSYLPPYIKVDPTLFLSNQGVQLMENNQVVEVPVTVTETMTCAAMSVIMNYPEKDVEILGVEAAYDKQALVYHTNGSELRIAWYTLQPQMLKKGDVLFTLKLRLNNTGNASSIDLGFDLNSRSNLADFNGHKLLNKTISMPTLVSSNQGFTLNQNIPNPFSTFTQIEYTLPEDSYIKLELLDVVGKQIAVLQDGQQASGSHTYVMNGNALAQGVYFYRMMVSTGSQKFSQTKRMVISR